MKKVYIETFGCQMNEYDTEIVKSVLTDEEFSMTATPDDADIVLLNTCSVRDNANRKVFGRIHALKHKSKGKSLHIGIIGCMATDFKEKLLTDPHLPIDFIVGPDSYRRLGSVILESLERNSKGFDVKLSKEETYEDIYPIRESGVNAWIAVMRGCNNFCSFCVVPYTRGRERSRSVNGIVDEVKKLVDEGFCQVTLLGQNVNSYQADGHDFAYLLEQVSLVKGIERVRFTSPHPKDFPYPLLQAVASNPKICKHIHLPLQAGNDRVLDMMRRTYTRAEYLKLVDDIKSYYPEMVLTTDIIVGFPTETDAEFLDTVKVMEYVEYDSAFIFKYSQRQGTLAQKHYPDDVGEDVKTTRIVRLNEIQKKHSLKKNKAHIGQTHRVLIEEEHTKKSSDDVQGRNDGNKLVILPGKTCKFGQIVDVKIVGATPHVLKGQLNDVVI